MTQNSNHRKQRLCDVGITSEFLEKTGNIDWHAGPSYQESPDSTAADPKWRVLARKVQNVLPRSTAHLQ